MLGPYPTGQFCIPDTTEVCDRVDMLNDMARVSVSDPSVQAMAHRILASADRLHPDAPHGLPDVWHRLLALETMRAVQAIGYKDTQGERDCYQMPAYTIANQGECKALSTLFVSIATALGLQAEVIWIDQVGAPKNHVVSRVKAGNEWMWADCSIAGAMLGESPYDALERVGQWHVVGGRNAGAAQASMPTGYVADGVRRGPYPDSPKRDIWFDPPTPERPLFDWDRVWQGWPLWWWARYYPSVYYRLVNPQFPYNYMVNP